MSEQEQNDLYAKIPVEELLQSEQEQSSLEEMSVAQLLDLLDDDVQTVSQIEQKKSQGVANLLKAISEQKPKMVEDRLDRFVAHTLKFRSPESFSTTHDDSKTGEADQQIVEIAIAKELLLQQEAKLASREIECEKVTIELLQAQEHLLNELDAVLERLDEDNDDYQQPLRRVA